MQRLSKAEEVAMCEFIQIMGAGGYPPSVKMVKRMAEEMAYYCDKDGEYDQQAPVPRVGRLELVLMLWHKQDLLKAV
jgi:hypothetical protein